jgi:4'-phosphopantetheinyl transferase
MQIWRIPLPLPEKTIARLNEWLSPEERERIARYHFAEDRARYTSARGALRVILASCLNEHPRSLSFGYGSFGKPHLTGVAAGHGIEFNLSHCSDLALIGVAVGAQVGVDVEAVREIPEMDQIVERHFTEQERSAIAAAGPASDARLRSFLQFWTRREAAAKARGLDLSAALSDLGVPPYSVSGGATFEQQGQGVWALQDLELDVRHTGALCVAGPTRVAVFRDFEPVLRSFDQ